MTRPEARRIKLMTHIDQAHAMADQFLTRARKASGRVPGVGYRFPKGPTRAEVKADRDARLATETADLRRKAWTRAGLVGELCGKPLPSPLVTCRFEEAPELCHLDGGSGKRRQRQWIGNVLFEHHECHQGPLGLDRKPLVWLPAVKDWCARHGYPLPERFRKLEALAPARSTKGENAP